MLAAGCAAALALAACSNSGGSSGTSYGAPSAAGSTATSAPSASSPTAGPSAGGIVISGFAYSGTLTVRAGQKVTVTNRDSAPHTVTDKTGGTFDSGTIAPGGTGSFTAPSKPGTYTFGCSIHPSMRGTLVVTG